MAVWAGWAGAPVVAGWARAAQRRSVSVEVGAVPDGEEEAKSDSACASATSGLLGGMMLGNMMNVSRSARVRPSWRAAC